MNDKFLHYIFSIGFQIVLLVVLWLFALLSKSIILAPSVLALIIGSLCWTFHEIGQQRARHPKQSWWKIWLWRRDGQLDLLCSILGHATPTFIIHGF